MDAPKIEVDMNGWDRWQKYVVTSLEDMKKGQDDLYSEVTDLRVAVGKLQVKAGLWGALGGFQPAAIMAAVVGLIKHS